MPGPGFASITLDDYTIKKLKQYWSCHKQELKDEHNVKTFAGLARHIITTYLKEEKFLRDGALYFDMIKGGGDKITR